MSERPTKLSKGLKQRHLTMIAIGGVIGAGLFVGSGVVIADTGPAAFLGYALTGVLIVLVMRMLGEMAAAHPSTGSFSDYARRAMGGWAGFSVGWLYWYFWVIVVGFEAVAGAKILTYWIDAPLWLLSLGLMVLMTATQSLLRLILRRVRVLVRRHQGLRHHRLPGARDLFCDRPVAEQGLGLQQPHRARWVLSVGRRGDLLQHRRGDLFDGRARNRHHRGGGIR